MGKFDEKISDKSVWITSTPTQTALALPFCVTEAGHFYAKSDYAVQRESHDSFLLLFTIKGCGIVQSGDAEIKLAEGNAVVIDCHTPHRYFSENTKWEFIWLHINGSAVPTFFELLYPNGLCAVNTIEDISEPAAEIMRRIRKSDILSIAEVSAIVHMIFNTLIKSSIESERMRNEGRYYDFVKHAADFIHNHYSEPLSIDEMISDIPMSKYHFIRTFKRIMGTTPYNYLTNYRINNAKIMLRTTDMPVSEIAERCGFLDTSNFIAQFRKHTQQKPHQYRRYFAAD